MGINLHKLRLQANHKVAGVVIDTIEGAIGGPATTDAHDGAVAVTCDVVARLAIESGTIYQNLICLQLDVCGQKNLGKTASESSK